MLVLAAAIAAAAPRAAGAIPACTAADIVGSDPGCPASSSTCTITRTYEIGDQCELDFGDRDVAVGTNALLNLGSNSVTIKAGSITVQPRGTISGTGNIGPTLCLETARNVHVQRVAGIGTGIIDVSARDIAGCLSLNARGSVTIDGNVLARNSGPGGVGGEIVFVIDGNLTTGSSSAIDASSSGEDSSGGNVDLFAAGNMQLAGSIIVTGAEGGSVLLNSGMNMTTGPISAQANRGANSGGVVEISADRSLTIAGNINVNASGPVQQSGACAGSVDAEAFFGDLTVSARIDANGSSPDGAGGCLLLTAAGDINIASNALLSVGTLGVEGCGGTIAVEAGIDVTHAGSAVVSGGFGGGVVDLLAARRITVTGSVDAKGRQAGSFGGAINVSAGPNPASQVQLTGLLDALGGTCSFEAGCGSGGCIDINACTVSVSSGGRALSTAGDGGSITLTARRQMTIAGRLTATTPAPTQGSNGVITLVFPNGSPPVTTGAQIAPPPQQISRPACTQLGQSNCLTPCPPCGNGIIEFPETCDLGNPTPVNCNGCSSACQIQVCEDNLICTANMCDPRLGCFFVPPATPCAEPTRTPTITLTPTITRTPTITETPTVTGTPTLTGTPTDTPTTTPTAPATSTATRTPTPIAGRPGDADCNGVIDAADFALVVRAVFDPPVCPGADVNRDGRVTAADPAAFLRTDPR